MPRTARIVFQEYPHHITQRGNYRQQVFSKGSEYSIYLKWLNEYAIRYELKILAYCLMPNHVHFAAIPYKPDSLSRTFNVCHMRYAQYFNKRNLVSGHLWQGRFYSSVLEDNHLYSVVRYIENNPVRARLVKEAWDWKWSSANAHLNNAKSILHLIDVKKYISDIDWAEYLHGSEEDMVIKTIRDRTLSGKPIGSDTFIERLERMSGRSLRALPRGRPVQK